MAPVRLDCLANKHNNSKRESRKLTDHGMQPMTEAELEAKTRKWNALQSRRFGNEKSTRFVDTGKQEYVFFKQADVVSAVANLGSLFTRLIDGSALFCLLTECRLNICESCSKTAAT